VIGEIHGREDPVSRTDNRQARRVALCSRARRPRHGKRRARAASRIWLTAYGHDLAAVAARIAGEIQLSEELVELLSPAGIPHQPTPGELCDPELFARRH
jgi:hypothetical protein